MSRRRGAGQQTDIDVARRASCWSSPPRATQHWASVRFSGHGARAPRTPSPVGFDEVWNLVKPADGSSGWLLAGIQQMH